MKRKKRTEAERVDLLNEITAQGMVNKKAFLDYWTKAGDRDLDDMLDNWEDIKEESR